MRSNVKTTRLNSLKDDLLTKSFPSSTHTQNEHSFKLSLSIFWLFNGVFLTITLVIKPPLYGDRAAAIFWKWIFFTKVSKYGNVNIQCSEYSLALNASYTFQPLASFCLYSISRFSSCSRFKTAFVVIRILVWQSISDLILFGLITCGWSVVPSQQWFSSRPNATLRRERSYFERPFDFPSSMRVHVTPTSKRQMTSIPLVSQEILGT